MDKQDFLLDHRLRSKSQESSPNSAITTDSWGLKEDDFDASLLTAPCQCQTSVLETYLQTFQEPKTRK